MTFSLLFNLPFVSHVVFSPHKPVRAPKISHMGHFQGTVRHAGSEKNCSGLHSRFPSARVGAADGASPGSTASQPARAESLLTPGAAATCRIPSLISTHRNSMHFISTLSYKHVRSQHAFDGTIRVDFCCFHAPRGPATSSGEPAARRLPRR